MDSGSVNDLHDRPRDGSSSEVRVLVVDTPLRLLAFGIFVIVAAAALYFAREFALPIAMAFLLALILSPVTRAFRRRGIPEPFTAVLLVLGIVSALGLATYSLSGPVSHWIADAPRIANDLRSKIIVLQRPFEAVADATSEVDNLTTAGEEPGVQQVVMKEPNLLSRLASGAPILGMQVGLTLVLLLFLLASGDMFYDKLVRAMPTFADKKLSLRIAKTIEREVSRYLFTITMINIGLGAMIGLSMWAIGMPNPVLWGIAAALLNFIPYLGGMIGIALVTIVAVVSFDTLEYALLAPLLYFFWNFLEGQIVTPAVVGRRLEMNAVAVFLAIAFWGWLWGIAGALIAVPMLLTVKIICDNVESLKPFGEFLGGRNGQDKPVEVTPARPA